MKAHWWRPGPSEEEGLRNFGDELCPQILMGMGIDLERVPIEDAEVIVGGSIVADAVQANPMVTIWGAGVGSLKPLQHQGKVLAARGRLTARTLGAPDDVPLGDTGLLAPLLYPKSQPVFDVGVVRHYIDDNDYPWADIVIGAWEPVETVIEKITMCRTIASTSLHGWLVAMAYGIPAMRLYHPAVLFADLKFADATTAFTRPLDVIRTDLLGALENL